MLTACSGLAKRTKLDSLVKGHQLIAEVWLSACSPPVRLPTLLHDPVTEFWSFWALPCANSAVNHRYFYVAFHQS